MTPGFASITYMQRAQWAIRAAAVCNWIALSIDFLFASMIGRCSTNKKTRKSKFSSNSDQTLLKIARRERLDNLVHC